MEARLHRCLPSLFRTAQEEGTNGTDGTDRQTPLFLAASQPPATGRRVFAPSSQGRRVGEDDLTAHQRGKVSARKSSPRRSVLGVLQRPASSDLCLALPNSQSERQGGCQCICTPLLFTDARRPSW